MDINNERTQNAPWIGWWVIFSCYTCKRLVGSLHHCPLQSLPPMWIKVEHVTWSHSFAAGPQWDKGGLGARDYNEYHALPTNYKTGPVVLLPLTEFKGCQFWLGCFWQVNCTTYSDFIESLFIGLYCVFNTSTVGFIKMSNSHLWFLRQEMVLIVLSPYFPQLVYFCCASPWGRYEPNFSWTIFGRDSYIVPS